MPNKHIAKIALAELFKLRHAKTFAQLSFDYAYAGGLIDGLMVGEIIDGKQYDRLCALKHNAYQVRAEEIGIIERKAA